MLTGLSVEIVERDALLCRVRISGEIDLATIGSLKREFAHVLDLVSPGERVVADAAGVRFLSAGGVRAIVGFAEKLKTGGGDLVIDAASPAVDQVLRVCGYATLMGVSKG
jgi:anti-anti-sigma factor